MSLRAVAASGGQLVDLKTFREYIAISTRADALCLAKFRMSKRIEDWDFVHNGKPARGAPRRQFRSINVMNLAAYRAARERPGARGNRDDRVNESMAELVALIQNERRERRAERRSWGWHAPESA
jgi:hypothetical protein